MGKKGKKGGGGGGGAGGDGGKGEPSTSATQPQTSGKKEAPKAAPPQREPAGVAPPIGPSGDFPALGEGGGQGKRRKKQEQAGAPPAEPPPQQRPPQQQQPPQRPPQQQQPPQRQPQQQPPPQRAPQQQQPPQQPPPPVEGASQGRRGKKGKQQQGPFEQKEQGQQQPQPPKVQQQQKQHKAQPQQQQPSAHQQQQPPMGQPRPEQQIPQQYQYLPSQGQPPPGWQRPQQQPQMGPPLQQQPALQPRQQTPPWQPQMGPPPQQQPALQPRQQTPPWQPQMGPPPQQQPALQPRQQTPPVQRPQMGPPPQQQPALQPRQQTPPMQRPQMGPPPQQQPALQPRQQTPPVQQPQASRQAEPRGPPRTAQPVSPPQRTGDVTSAMRSISISEGSSAGGIGLTIPKRQHDRRPVKPKPGRRILIETNHLELKFKNPNATVHHYDVSVEPEKPFRHYRRALEAVREKCYPNCWPSFDGKKNLYSFNKLPPLVKSNELTTAVNIWDDERDQEKEVEVTIKYANSVDLSSILAYFKNGASTNTPQDAIQALDVVLRQPAASRFVQVGRSYFTQPQGQIIHLGDGMDLWYGSFQSAIMGWKPFLNIDVAHKGFPEPCDCITSLASVCNVDRRNVVDPRFQMDSRQDRTFTDYIKNLKVVYEIPGRNRRTYKVVGLAKPPKDNVFDMEDPPKSGITKKTTVERYFKAKYGVALRSPHLPCLVAGSVAKPISLPIELCSVAIGQVTMKKLNETQTRNMVRTAATNTELRKKKIMSSMGVLDFNRSPYVREFGLSVSDNFHKVDARIINAPTLDYSNKQSVQVRSGVWRNEKFLKAAKLEKWCILNAQIRMRDDTLRKLAEMLIQHGQECGMELSEVGEIVTAQYPKEVSNHFGRWAKSGIQLVVVILPDRGITYATIKKTAELQVGILTQCLKTITVERRLNPATCVNILQKINAKLDGINHNISKRTPESIWPEFFKRPVMVVGADVTHPSPDQKDVPSIAAVAASHDPNAFKYNMIWRLQPPREEMILDLKEIMVKQLRFFYNTTRQQPQVILFYRDGVSEGQFRKVLEIELQAIRNACSSLSQTYKPAIIFLVVQKRHHTRFFPQKGDGDPKNQNVPAGTVVDTEITHPTELDFYLVSHNSIQGTARPTKYHLLWDDANISEKDLEDITYYLCHLFTRCCRSVSYPAPTYYAHLAAFRARSYTECEGMERLSLDNLDMEQKSRTVDENFLKSNPMYFV